MLAVSDRPHRTRANLNESHDHPARLVPRPDQVEAVGAVLERLDEAGTRTQLRKACGTGKTLDGVKILEGLDQPRNLLLFPSLSLIAQTLEVHGTQASCDREYLVVCSDPSVVRRISEDAAHYTEEDLGIRVTSDPGVVRQFLSSGSGQKVVLATYQSGDVVASAQKELRLAGRAASFGFAAFDEAHHCTGIAGGQFTRPLDNAFIHADRRLFMTATPRIYTERVKSAGAEAGKTILSMDDADHFGEVAFSLPFSRAIEKGLLTPYEVLVVAVNEKEIPGLSLEAGRPKLRGREVSERDLHLLASYVALQKAMTEFDLKRVITFHNSVSRAQRFADYTRPDSFHAAATEVASRFADNLLTLAIDGAMPAAERKQHLDRLRSLPAGMRGVFSNCRCLGEGVDVPTLDAVCFVDDRQSVTDLVQAVGRVIRKAPDKHVGRVILAVFVPSGADPEQVLDGSSFRKVWQVLRALQAHDDTLSDTLDALRRSGRQRIDIEGNGSRLPVRLRGQNLPAPLLRDLDRAITVQAVTRMAPRPLTLSIIRDWIGEHRDRTQNWPNSNSGLVGAPSGNGENWGSINNALRGGWRNLPAGGSLDDLVSTMKKDRGEVTNPDLLREIRREASHQAVDTLSVDLIKEWIRGEYEATKMWPRVHGGKVQVDRVGESWSNIRRYLADGLRGLPGGQTLGDLITEVREAVGDTTKRTIGEIKEAVWQSHLLSGSKVWPSAQHKTPVPGGRFTSWSAIDSALSCGSLGLPGGTRLANLVAEVKAEHGLSDTLNPEKVRLWIVEHHRNTGCWPKCTDQKVVADGAETESWANIDKTLRTGYRGLPSGGSLRQYVESLRRETGEVVEISLELIKDWMKAEFAVTQRWPTKADGAIKVPGVNSNTWSAVSQALKKGQRGLPPGTSFIALRLEAQEEYARQTHERSHG